MDPLMTTDSAALQPVATLSSCHTRYTHNSGYTCTTTFFILFLLSCCGLKLCNPSTSLKVPRRSGHVVAQSPLDNAPEKEKNYFPLLFFVL